MVCGVVIVCWGTFSSACWSVCGGTILPDEDGHELVSFGLQHWSV